MASFSERYGHVKISDTLLTDNIDDPLRTRLWNVYVMSARPALNMYDPSEFNIKFVHRFMAMSLSELRGDKWGDNATVEGTMLEVFHGRAWYRVYDLIEFIIANLPEQGDEFTSQFITMANEELEFGRAGYRIVGGLVAPITNQEEIATLEQAIKTPLAAVAEHVTTAIVLYSKRPSPDFRNSIKESISAVEAMCCLVTKQPKATLGQAIKRLQDVGVVLHPSMVGAFDKLYGYTSNSGGIRHSLLDEDKADGPAAKFMLVACSAFVNYITEICASNNIPL